MLLFFDTETTGIPKSYNAPITDLDNWPRLVQIGWIVYDDKQEVVSEAEYIIKPEGFVIPDDVSKIHGITTEIAEMNGVSLREVLGKFAWQATLSSIVVGHNLSYDDSVVSAEFLRCGIENPLTQKPKICTMKASTNYCKITGGMRGYKWPKLHELFSVLFHSEMGAAHTALMDIRNTAKCYFELKRLGVV